ncbi:MAG: hydroxyacylglutathione hydrolase [Methylococcaceae bacterium]|nr:hydroxyacylglutathione hydrolase [Methylococcaceae bacterium]
MLEILQIPVLNDNYIYLVHEPNGWATAAIDPALAEPVLQALDERGWKLTHILNTHHHGDHVGGNLELKRKTGCAIIAMGRDKERIPGIDVEVAEGDLVSLGHAEARVLDVPGHTSGHIAFWFAEDLALFCGDTLFGLGCGRLFEGHAREMWDSLEKIRSLPGQARIFCAHEYTLANGRFALTVEPENPALLERMDRVQALREQGLPTVPSLLADELAANPFLRPDSPAIRQRLMMPNAQDWQVFAEIRRMKDEFVG